jgi:hypothetical protein
LAEGNECGARRHRNAKQLRDRRTEVTKDQSNGEPIERFDRGNPARRCLAHRKNGEQCRNWAIQGHHVCRYHGGAAPQTKAAAREFLELQALKNARDNLQELADNAKSEDVRLRATNSALDRAGLKPPTEVDVGVKQPYEALIEGGVTVSGIAPITRAESLARRGLAPEPAALDAPIDAEVVEDPARDMGAAHADIDGEPPKGEQRGFRPDPASASGPSRGLMTMEEAVEGQRTWISSQRIRRAR